VRGNLDSYYLPNIVHSTPDTHDETMDAPYFDLG
jgi:hypothetical protein